MRLIKRDERVFFLLAGWDKNTGNDCHIKIQSIGTVSHFDTLWADRVMVIIFTVSNKILRLNELRLACHFGLLDAERNEVRQTKLYLCRCVSGFKSSAGGG